MEIVNYKIKSERVLKFLNAINLPTSRRRIMKGTGIPFNNLKYVIVQMVEEKKIIEIKTTGSTYFKVWTAPHIQHKEQPL